MPDSAQSRSQRSGLASLVDASTSRTSSGTPDSTRQHEGAGLTWFRDHLDEATFAEEWEQSRGLMADDAVAFGLDF